MNQQEEAAWELHLFLTEVGAPYAIIGGMAANTGESRASRRTSILRLSLPQGALHS